MPDRRNKLWSLEARDNPWTVAYSEADVVSRMGSTSLQEQKERPLAHGKLMELMKQIDGTRGYFVDEMNELPNVFAPLLGTQGDH
jgi:hypothetical protein